MFSFIHSFGVTPWMMSPLVMPLLEIKE